MRRIYSRSLKLILLCSVSLASNALAQATGVTPAVRKFSGNCLGYYPLVSERIREEGTVTLSGVIQKDGTIRDLKVENSSGKTRLDDAAIQCVSSWSYAPATKDGQPVETPMHPQIVWKVANPPSISDVSKSIDASPNDVSLLVLRASLYMNWSPIQPARAVEDYKHALQLEPDDVTIYVALAKAQDANKDAAARQTLDMALARAPRSTLVLKARGDYLLAHDAPAAARADYDTALQIDPSDRQAHLSRAAALAVLKEGAAARTDLDFVLQANQDDDIAVKALTNRARLSNSEGQVSLAVKDYDRLAELRPSLGSNNDSCCAHGLANLELEQGLVYCERALKLAGKYPYPEAQGSEGLIYFRMGRLDDAMTAYNMALQHDNWSNFLYLRGVARKRLGDSSGDADIVAARKLDAFVADKFAVYGIVP